MIILSNILGAISDILCGIAGFAKTKRNIQLINIISNIAGIICDTIIGGYTAVVTLIMSMLSEILNYGRELGKIYATVYTVILTVVSFYISTNGVIDTLPVIANAEYIIVISCTKDVQKIRIALLVNTILWCIFNTTFNIYTSAIIEIISATLLLIKIIKENRKEK